MRASESDRALICPASLVLPRHEVTRPETTVRAADYGTLVHYWKESGDFEPEWADPRDADCLERKIMQTDTRREDWWVGGQHEVAFAINLKTGYSERYKGPREYADAWKAGHYGWPEWLTGTIDYIYDDGGIDDLKTGRWPVSPKDNKQLLSYGLLPWLEAGAPLKWNKRGSITSWPKYPLSAPPKRSVADLTGFALADHMADLLWAVTHPGEVNVVDEEYDDNGVRTEMSNCSFCPCREPHGASSWMTKWNHARLPLCTPGLLSRIER